MKKILTTWIILLMFFAAAAWGQEEAEGAGESGSRQELGFAGPAAVTSQLQEDEEAKKSAFRIPWIDRILQPWFDGKAALKKKTGLQLGVAYTALYQTTSESEEAGGGIARISGSWAIFNRDSANSGNLVFSVDARNAYSDPAPGEIAFGMDSGYLGIPGTLFSDVGMILGDVNWQQSLNDGRTGIVLGRYDPNDFFDVLGYANPWTTFQNLAILFNPSISLPDWSYGISAGHWLNSQYYLKASLNDANGNATHLKFFSEGAEFYSTGEIGWSPSRAERYLKNFHLMGWHVDDATRAELPESHGIAFGGNWTWKETWMAFTKMGWSEGAAPLYNKSVTVGGVYHVARRSDLLGLGLNWGEPADSSLRDQVTSELFYRFQLAENLAITPSVQWILKPALNPEEDELWIGGIRARLAL